MHIQVVRRRKFAIAGALAVVCASFSATHAITISSGTYTGYAGGTASGSEINMGDDGGDGYSFGSNATDLITGDTWIR